MISLGSKYSEISTLRERDQVIEYAQSILADKFNKLGPKGSYGSSPSTGKRATNLLNKCIEESIAHLGLYKFIYKIPSSLGFFYVISNKHFPNYYKVGHSIDAESRLIQYQTYSPHRDFELVRYIPVLNAKQVEFSILDIFSSKLSNEWLYSENIGEDLQNMMTIASDVTRMPNRWCTSNIPEELLDSYRFFRDRLYKG